MGNRNFMELLHRKWQESKFVSVGLDVEVGKIPNCLTTSDGMQRVLEFNMTIINNTIHTVGCYKPNIAFYEQYGADGLLVLKKTIEHINHVDVKVPVILDCKRADIGSTNNGYVKAAFDYLKADAITVNPFFGAEALKPFLDQKDKGVIVLCRTSNPGSGEFQDLMVSGEDVPKTLMPFYQYVAHRVCKTWNSNENCALVVGATFPQELGEVREIVGDMPILIPGIGAQGGDLHHAIGNGKDSNDQGMIINSSRGIIYASSGSDFGRAAGNETVKLTNEIIACIHQLKKNQ